jgi:hypothetical protein
MDGTVNGEQIHSLTAAFLTALQSCTTTCLQNDAALAARQSELLHTRAQLHASIYHSSGAVLSCKCMAHCSAAPCRTNLGVSAGNMATWYGYMTGRFRLPAGVSCPNGCVLQWEYLVRPWVLYDSPWSKPSRF